MDKLPLHNSEPCVPQSVTECFNSPLQECNVVEKIISLARFTLFNAN